MSAALNSELLAILRCPDCGGSLNVESDERALRCSGCGRDFEVTRDGVVCLLPLNAPKLPADYDDPDYRRMSEMFDCAVDYFTDGNSIFHAIHESGHRTIARWREESAQSGWTCDLGCGTGYHYKYLKSLSHYVGVDIRLDSLRRIRSAFPAAYLVQGNSCALPFRDNAFTTILSIYAFEHIYHLSRSVGEVERVLEPGGQVFVGLPCEGGLGWTLGRKLTSEREMSKRYSLDYRKYIALEHCNTAKKVIDEFRRRFRLESRNYFPLSFIPLVDVNLTVSAAFRKAAPSAS